MINVQNFQLDVSVPAIKRLRLVNGDTANQFVITVTNNKAPVTLDASLHKVIAVFKRADGQVYTQDANTGVSFTTSGVVAVDVRPASFRTGTNTICLQIYKREDSSATVYPLLLTTQEQQFNARSAAIPESGAPISPSQYPMLERYVLAAKSYANGNTGTRDGENIDNAMYYKDLAEQAVQGGIVDPTIGAWLDDHSSHIDGVITDEVDEWLDDHPEATTTVQDGAITRTKLNESLIEMANSVDAHMTTFVKPVNNEYISATLADFDPNYRAYEGVQVTSAGIVAASALYNSYAFVCPYDGFTFKTQMYRIFVATAYPEVGVTLPIKTVIANGSSDMTAVRTIANKGDIVVLCNPNANSTVYLASPYKNIAKIKNLVLDDALDTFKQNAFIDSGVSEIGNDKLNIQIAEGKLITSTTGGLSNNASYDTYYFRVPVNELTVKCTNGFRACLSLTDPSLAQVVANLKQLLYNNSSGRVETFTAHLNDWVVISVAKSAGAIDLKTDYVNRFTLPGLRLDWRQANSFYKYVTETNAKRLYVYYKSGNKYVRWELHNVPSVNSNSNTWQLGAIYGYDESLITGVELVAAGEFELAFKEYGAADYCGGNNHGDENTDDFTLMIDGKVITLTDLDSAYHAFDRIDVIEHATVNRCDTPDEDILKHQKVWTFENGTVKVWQTLEFLEDILCDFLCCMLAANRSAFQYGVRQGRVGTEVMTSTDYERVVTKGNEMMYLMYGANASAKVTARCADHTPEASLWINNAAALNKLYYNYFGQIPNTQVASGTVLKWESEYDVAYN